MEQDPRARLRRAAGWALVAGLTTAALTAVAAVLSGDFDDTDGRVILTSIGFALCSSAAAAGATQRFRSEEWLRALGTVTVGFSGAAFVLLLAGLWTGDWGSEGIWRAFGCVALLGIAGSHACVVLGARRPSDSALIGFLVIASLGLAALDTGGALLPISGAVEEVDESFEEAVEKLFAVTLILLVLTTVLPALLRRLQQRSPGREGAVAPIERFGAEVEAIADRIEDLTRGPGLRTPEIRREATRLRDLARSFQA
jgi:hypothetical protein